MKFETSNPREEGEQKIDIRIDPWDTWNMDYTLALIIHPMLIQLKETKHGSPCVDDEDVPENIRRSSATPTEHDWQTDEFFHDRWSYVLDEMIWGFGEMKKETFWKLNEKENERFHNAFCLFGKYFTNLWD